MTPPTTVPEDPRPLRLLLVDDSEDDAFLLLRHFRAAGRRCESERVDTREAMREALLRQAWDAVLSDHRMPRFSALAALELLQELGLDLPFLIISGVIEEETAVAAMRAGAHDYLRKDRLDRLVPALERELREARNRAERRSALDSVRESELRLRALAANIPGMVFRLTRTGEADWRFLYVSDGAAAVLGIQGAELLSQPQCFFDMVPEPDRDRLVEALRASAGTLGAVNWEGRVLTPAADQKWVNLRSSTRRSEAGGVVWDGALFNITQSKETELELRRSRSQLADLSAHLESAKEEERERIARDIHDELGGTLVAVKFEVARLAAKAPAELSVHARRASELVDDAIATAGRVARELRPGILKAFGLAAAIECQAEDFSARTGIPCTVRCADLEIAPDAETATALFRVFQEALTNVAKHARAGSVEVRLTQEGNETVLEVIDDGCGVEEDDLSKPRSFGLRGMRERVHGLGGTMAIGTARPSGTRVCIRVPARPAEAAGDFASATSAQASRERVRTPT